MLRQTPSHRKARDMHLRTHTHQVHKSIMHQCTVFVSGVRDARYGAGHGTHGTMTGAAASGSSGGGVFSISRNTPSGFYDMIRMEEYLPVDDTASTNRGRERDLVW